MEKQKQVKETIENWLKSVDIEDKEMFDSYIMEIKDVVDSYVNDIHKEQIKEIMFIMNELENLSHMLYYEMSEEAEEELSKEIEVLKKFLGFDERFRSLLIKW